MGWDPTHRKGMGSRVGPNPESRVPIECQGGDGEGAH